MKAIFTAMCIWLAMAIQPANAGIFTTLSVTVYDQVYNLKHVYTDCVIDEMDEHASTMRFYADCGNETVTSGATAPTSFTFIPYQVVNVNGNPFPFTVCRKIVDDTTFIPGAGGPSGTRPTSHRDVAFRCTDGST